MKTTRKLFLGLALAALPLMAQDAPAPAPTPEESPSAVADSAPEEAALNAAKELLAFIDEMNAIAATDKPVEEKAADIRALKARAEELGSVVTGIGMPKIQRAARTLMTEDEMEARTAAIDEAEEDETFRAALDDIQAALERQLPPTATPEEVAAEFLAALREGAGLAKAEALPRQERIDRLESMAMRLHRFYPWIEQGGDGKAVADILVASGVMDALIEAHRGMVPWVEEGQDVQLAQATFFYLSALGEVQGELYNRHLPKPPPSEEALAIAKRALALSDTVYGIATSDKGKDEKLAELGALEAEATAIGTEVREQGREEVTRAIESLYAAKERDQRLAKLDTAADIEAVRPLIQKLVILMSGEEFVEEEEYDDEYEPDEETAPKQERPSDALAEPSAEAQAAARGMVDFSQAALAILTSDQSTEAKREALRALKPQAVEVGHMVKAIPMAELGRAVAPLLGELGGKEEMLDEAIANDAELGPVLDELSAIMRGEPDPANPAPPAEMAEEFLGILGSYTAVMTNEALSEEQKRDALISLNNRLYVCGLWAERSDKCAELRGLVQQEGKLAAALKAVEDIAATSPKRKGGEANFQASMFSQILDEVLESFGLATKDKSAPDTNVFPEE